MPLPGDTRPHVLLLCEHYRAGYPEWGPSDLQHMMIQPAQELGLFTLAHGHYDARWLWHQDQVYPLTDRFVCEYCASVRPDVVVLEVIRRSPDAPNPSRRTLAYIAQTLGIPIVGVLWDAGPCSIQMYDAHYPMVRHVILASNYCPVQDTRYPGRFSWDWWATLSATLVEDQMLVRDIPISSQGRTQAGSIREHGIHALQAAGVSVYVDPSRLSIEEYVRIYHRSKIVVNFPSYLNGRVFETCLCGALLCEPAGTEAARYFVPGQEYVTYVDMAQLADRVQYYLDHEDERAQIARAGHDRAHQNYTADRWWRKLWFHACGAASPLGAV